MTMQEDNRGWRKVQGSTPGGDANAGNPVGVGGRADTGVPASVDDGDRQVLWVDERGAVAVKLVDPSDGADVVQSYLQDTSGITAAGGGTALDMSASPKTKYGLTFLRTAGATTTIQVKIQGSMDGVTWGDIAAPSASNETTFFGEGAASYIRYSVTTVGAGNTLRIYLLAV
jgi:hypothetical protein